MKAAVIIPVYAEAFTNNEEKSLHQVRKILGGFNIIFICPKSFSIDNYLKIIPEASVERFGDGYFKSVQGYSRLMYSPTFYFRFRQYEYILICQLDAYVFDNQLLHWCAKGYDYIGAPWLTPPPLNGKKPLIDMTGWFVNKVGNGGFSLRKVRSHLFNSILFRPLTLFLSKNEDIFWGVLISWMNPFFKKPDYKEALLFAFEMNVSKSLEITAGKLPFGVHAWEKYDKEFWKNYIH